MTVFWNVAPCSLVDVTDVSEVLAASIIRAVSHHSDGEAACISEMSVNFYQTTRRNIPEYSLQFLLLLTSHLILREYLTWAVTIL
jgi:hypothetical protein